MSSNEDPEREDIVLQWSEMRVLISLSFLRNWNGTASELRTELQQIKQINVRSKKVGRMLAEESPHARCPVPLPLSQHNLL